MARNSATMSMESVSYSRIRAISRYLIFSCQCAVEEILYVYWLESACLKNGLHGTPVRTKQST